MSTKFLKILNDKANENPDLKLLLDQWGIDEIIISKALQNIGTIFPNYSRHDVSHSKQILTNIERIFGDSILNLTATDAWLMLEAAYWHDIGMIVTSDNIVKDIRSNEFGDYLVDLSSSKDNELCNFAGEFLNGISNNYFAFKDSPQRFIELYRQLIAGWYRKKHPERAKEIINNPWETVGINSPRNELVPNRLFQLLGQICKMHGANFEEMINNLPFCATGIATDNCHPRFIACLLRLGDLFDLDNNRFCPVMLRVAGENPSSTKAHIDKHISIKHFRLDSDRIEIKAECESYEGYEITDLWFHWIEEEIKKQMTHWMDIVPSRNFGFLPTLGNMEVNLTPPNEILNPGKRPRFSVDPYKTIELLQGAGIYKDKWQCIRELLQNAVDATLIRIWLTYKNGKEYNNGLLNWDSPNSEDIKEIFKNFPISVNLKRLQNDGAGNEEWELDINDKGIGISKKDLHFMELVGSSSRNKTREKIISEMPKWMRPSGTFGIGLQSIFLITSEINFDTKSMLSEDSLKIRMTTPLNKGLIFIQQKSNLIGSTYGTSLSLNIKTKTIPNEISFSSGHNYSQLFLLSFDPIKPNEVTFEIAKIVDEVINFSSYSFIPINFKINEKPFPINRIIRNRSNSFYDSKTGIEVLNISFIPDIYNFTNIVNFRNQKISLYKPKFEFVNFNVNILDNITQDTLTIDRNNVKETARENINKKIKDTIIDYIKESTNSNDCKESKSAFLHLYGNDSDNTSNDWVNLSLPSINKTINQLCQLKQFKIILFDQNNNNYFPNLNNANEYFLEFNNVNKECFELLVENWSILDGKIRVELSQGGSNNTILNFLKFETLPFTDEYLKYILKKKLITNIDFPFSSRYFIPVFNNFEDLSVERLPLWSSSLLPIINSTDNFVLPFYHNNKGKKVTTEGFEELCKWTFNNKKRNNIKETDIKELYKNFITWVDDDLMKGDTIWKNNRLKKE